MARVLLVEDDNTLREVMGFALEDQGFTCEHAPNGRVGLEKLCEATVRHEPYDCILLDIVMPEVDGWQFLEAVKSNPLWRDLRVVVMSGFATNPRDVARASALDCMHLPKSARFMDLLGPFVQRIVAAS